MGLTIGNACISSISASEEKFADYRYAAYRAAFDLGFQVVRDPEDMGPAREKLENRLQKNYPVFILLIGGLSSRNAINIIKKKCNYALDLGLEIIPCLKTENETISTEEKKLKNSISKITFRSDCLCFHSCEKLYNILKERLIQYTKNSKDAAAVLIPQHTQIYVNATDFTLRAKRRLIICQKTSTLILGPRSGSTVESTFYDIATNWISSSSKNMEFLHIFSLKETKKELGCSEYDLLEAKRRLLDILNRNSNKKNIMFRVVDDRVVPCVIGDNEMLISAAVGTYEYNLALPKYIMDTSALKTFVADLQNCGTPCSSQEISDLYSF